MSGNPDPVVEVEGGPRLGLTMRVEVDGETAAFASVGSDRVKPPPGWMEKGREWRDDDLLWWFEEAGNVWLDGLFERFPTAGPKQEVLL